MTLMSMLVFRSVIPTKRGHQISKMNFREVDCVDEEFSKYIENSFCLLFAVHGRFLAPHFSTFLFVSWCFLTKAKP